jgi:hypothetical protein
VPPPPQPALTAIDANNDPQRNTISRLETCIMTSSSQSGVIAAPPSGGPLRRLRKKTPRGYSGGFVNESHAAIAQSTTDRSDAREAPSRAWTEIPWMSVA